MEKENKNKTLPDPFDDPALGFLRTNKSVSSSESSDSDGAEQKPENIYDKIIK